MSARRSDAGFTLVEVLVATAVASIGFLGLAATHIASVRATAVGRNVSVATTIAAEELEAMRRMPFADIASVSPTSETRGSLTFTRSAVVDGLGSSSKKVTMDVGWNDQFGAHNVQLITVIGQ